MPSLSVVLNRVVHPSPHSPATLVVRADRRRESRVGMFPARRSVSRSASAVGRMVGKVKSGGRVTFSNPGGRVRLSSGGSVKLSSGGSVKLVRSNGGSVTFSSMGGMVMLNGSVGNVKSGGTVGTVTVDGSVGIVMFGGMVGRVSGRDGKVEPPGRVGVVIEGSVDGRVGMVKPPGKVGRVKSSGTVGIVSPPGNVNGGDVVASSLPSPLLWRRSMRCRSSCRNGILAPSPYSLRLVVAATAQRTAAHEASSKKLNAKIFIFLAKALCKAYYIPAEELKPDVFSLNNKLAD